MTATFTLTVPLLLQLLQLPDGTEAEAIYVDYPENPHDLAITVSHPDLKEGPCLPTYERDNDGPRFVGWGQK